VTIHPHEFSQEGFWKGWIAVTRSGVFRYLTEDGQEIWLRRDPIDVFSEEHLDSLKGMPIVISHPRNGVNSLNISDDDRSPVGAILSQFDYPTDEDGNPIDGYLHAQAVIWKQDAIELATNHGEVSEGYSFEYSAESGEAIDINDSGEWTVPRTYKGRQKKPIANHVAILDSTEKGRAGTYARVVFDDDKGTIDLDESIPIAESEPVTENVSEESVNETESAIEPESVDAADSINEDYGDGVPANDSIYDLAPTDSNGEFTIDNSNDPVYRMLKMVANAASIASWLYISPHIELNPGNIARSIISAINYSADLPENDDMAIMKAELLLETVNSAWDSEDVKPVVTQIGDTATGKLSFAPKSIIATSQPEPKASIDPTSQAVATDSKTRMTIAPLPDSQPKPNPTFVRMANDAKTIASSGGKPDRTSSLYKNWGK
jgi:hypothetical protein